MARLWPWRFADVMNPEDGTVVSQWTLESGFNRRELRPSPTDDLALIPMYDGPVQVRSLPDGESIGAITDAGGTLRFSADGRRLMTVADDQALVFSTDDWTPLRTWEFSPDSFVTDARITSDGSQAAVARGGETVVWKVEEDAAPVVIPAEGALEFGRTEDELWTLGREGQLDLWRLSDGTRLDGTTIPVTHYTATLSPDRQLILTSSGTNEPLKLWRLDNGSLVGRLGGPTAIRINYFNPSPDGRWVVATRRDGSNIAFEFPFVLEDLEIANNPVHFQLMGTSGLFQIESSSGQGPNWQWEPLGEPFDGEAAIPLDTRPARFFRVTHAE